MAFEAGYNARLLLGSYSLSQFTDSISTASSTDMLDVTVHESTSHAKEFIPGLSSSTLTVKGPADVSGSSTALVGQLNTWKGGSGTPVTFGHKGFAVNQDILLVNGLETTFDVSSTVAGRVEWSAAALNHNLTSHNGVSLHDLSAETATGNGTEVDSGASSANGAVGHIHVTAFSGLTSMAVKVRHATSSGGTYSDLLTFTTATGLTSERVTVTGTVNQFLKLAFTAVGTGSITFAVGLARL